MKISLGSKLLLVLLERFIKRDVSLALRVEKILSMGQGDELSALADWGARGYQLPAPPGVKREVLGRHNLPRSTWVETGTLYGDTTDYLSRLAERVFSIEPEPNLYAKAQERFRTNSKVHLINDISENALPSLLPTQRGNVCFYLDGHYSAGNTFAGPNDTPLIYELACIRDNISRFDRLVILIDDIRLCGRKHIYGSYPSLDYLVDFCRGSSLTWSIEQDIFIIKSG